MFLVITRLSTPRVPAAISRSSLSSYIASTSVLNRSYISLRLTLRVGVTGSPSSSGSSTFGRMRNALDLLDAREIAIGLVDLVSDQRFDARVLREAGEAGVGDVVGPRPIGDRIEVDLDERGEIFAAMPEHDSFRNIRACAQSVLDEGGRDGLAA